MKRTLLVIGQLPPPTTGASAVTSSLVTKLLSRGYSVCVASTAPDSLQKDWGYHRARIIAHVRAAADLLRRKDELGSVYFTAPHGFGILYLLPLVLMGRLARLQIVLHHHSSYYLRKRTLLMRILTTLAGARSVHLLLSDKMCEDFQCHYIGQAFVLPNDAFIEPPRRTQPFTARRGLPRIGHIGNLSFEKGLGEVLSLSKLLIASGTIAGCTIAGSAAKGSAEEAMLSESARSDGIEHLGAVYGSDRAEFFESIDILLMPSHYKNEAQPLVVLEALSLGIPSAVTEWGYMPECVRGTGLVLAEDQNAWISQLTDFLTNSDWPTVQELSWREFDRRLRVSEHALTAVERLLAL